MMHLLFVATLVIFTTVSTSFSLGYSVSDPAYSAKQILNSGSSIGDGLYWIDTDGAGGSSAFEIYADMTSAGGGWTLGVNSLFNDESSSADMISNTGTVGLNTSHTRNLSSLAIEQNAEIRHRITGLSGQVILDGYYTGSYHDNLGTADQWTILDGSLDALTYHLGRPWSTFDDDNDAYSGNCSGLYGTGWYYGSCWTTIPTTPTNNSWDSPYAGTSRVDGKMSQYQIFVRESFTPPVIQDPPVPTPEPSTWVLLSSGLVGLAWYGRKRKKA